MRDWLCCSGNRQCTEKESQISLILYCVSLTTWQFWRIDTVCISDNSSNGVLNSCNQIYKICFVVAVKWRSDVTDGQCKMYCSCAGSFWQWGQHSFNQGWYTWWLCTHGLINTVPQISRCCYFWSLEILYFHLPFFHPYISVLSGYFQLNCFVFGLFSFF